jgi:hypothetical protein
MPVWSWFFIAAAVLIAFTLVWIAVRSVTGRKRTTRLRKHFGPEYERSVGEAGDQRAGEQELVARDVCGTLADGAAAFVDDPSRAVGDAEQLTAGFSEARLRLEAQWARGENASTEDLRLALRRYREFFQRLLAV